MNHEDVGSSLEVIRLGHPVLRSVAEPVPESWLDSGRLHEFGLKLVQTMIEEEGVGLAAPQVAESLRLFAYWVPALDGQPEISPQVLINPEIRPMPSEPESGWEGCLSIPGLRGLVPRACRIKVKARRIDGSPVALTANGFHARVLQHEYDHLDGVVFLDRMDSLESLAFESEWEDHVLDSEENES